MAGEGIEDMSIELLRASDADVQSKCQFPMPGSSEQADRKLIESVQEGVLHEMRREAHSVGPAIEAEFRQILADR